MTASRLRTVLLIALPLFGGCLPFLRTTTVPMRTLELSAHGDEPRCLAVLLPGRWGGPRDFERSGFGRQVAERGLALDLVAVDAHLGYYRERSILERLRADVIQPARAAGYREIWVVGASLGGLGALLVLEQHPDEIEGVVSLAPYLGEPEVIQEVRAAGGPRHYTPADPDDLRRIWAWLGRRLSAEEPPPIVLGFGRRDDFAPANRLLARELPAEQVLETSGGHDWKVWSRVWGELLDRGLLCSSGG